MNKIHSIVFLLIFVTILSSCEEEPIGTRINFNSNWKFFYGDDSLASNPDYDDSGWRMLNLPHDWSIEGEFSKEHPSDPRGGALPTGIAWYRKTFGLINSEKNKRFFIDFDGIYRNSEVWINGHYLGKRANGYISFRYELTPYLRFEKEHNIIAVRVDNSLQPNSRWYTGSGIYRNVRLVSTFRLHIGQWGVYITAPEIKEQHTKVEIEIRLNGMVTDLETIKIVTSIFDQNNIKAAKVSSHIKDNRTLHSGISQELSVLNPKLWSPDNPHLYIVKTEIFIDGNKADESIIPFGIRYFHFNADSGFYLNGKPLKIHGVNLHHDLGALGAAVNARAMERQLELMKGMGCNAIRTAHNPPAPEFLDLCDRMGFLVIDEAFDVWQKKKVKYDYSIDWEENHKNDLRDMILRDRNHPSVIAWSIGNEIREQFDSTGFVITRELVAIVKSLDTTRPVICALTETDPAKNFIVQSGALDLLGFNYKHEDWAKFRENFPGQKMIPTENMSAFASRGHYDMPSDSVRYWPEKPGEPIVGANNDYTVSAYDMVCAYWGSTHEETLKEFHKYAFIPGIFVWSGMDYIGEPEPYGWPAKNSYYGVVDLAGFPKDVYYLYQSIWTEKPTLHVFPHWNWETGNNIDVWAYYSQADEVELFLNNTSLGTRKKENGNMHVMWRVQYQPGTLMTISRQDGNIVLEKTIRTAGEPARIEMTADRSTIHADGCDLSFITVKITDKEGNLVPNADNLVHFKASGCGFLAGVDNGYQASHESFKGSSRKAFNGMCLAIIQSNGTAGKITITASSEELLPASVLLNAK
ncbi:MAG: DUF4982 domain-containing protein [Bacteroidales bacterium]|nr:DUF4982 domain-containing protein [Bacteroidales bacterium]